MEQYFFVIENHGEGNMIYKNHRHYPVSREELEMIQSSINNSLKYFDENRIKDDIELERLEQIERDKFTHLMMFGSRTNKKKEEKPKKKDYLYLIINEESNHLKIGRSVNPKSRLKQLQVASHDKLQLLFMIPDVGETEKDMHEVFNHLRVNSEWFKYDYSIILKFNQLSINNL